jgi:hypothetical protein
MYIVLLLKTDLLSKQKRENKLQLQLQNYYYLNAAEEEIASRSEAISDGAERVLNFSILYTHPPTPTQPHTHTYSPT